MSSAWRSDVAKQIHLRNAAQTDAFRAVFTSYAALLRRAEAAARAGATNGNGGGGGGSGALSAAAQLEVEQLRSQLQDGYKRLVDLTGKLSDSNSALKTVSAEASTAQSELERARSEAILLNERTSKAESVADMLRVEIDAANQRYQAIHVELERANKRISELTAQADESKTQEKSYRRELQKMMDMVNNLNEETARLLSMYNQAMREGGPRANAAGSQGSAASAAGADSDMLLSKVGVCVPPKAVRRTIEAHTEAVTCLEYNYTGSQFLSGGADGKVKLWDSMTGMLMKTLVGPSKSVLSAAFSASSELVVGGSGDNNLWIWNGSTERMMHTLTGHTDKVSSVVFFTSDGVLSGSFDRTLKTWDLGRLVCSRTILVGSRCNDAETIHSGKAAVTAHFDRTVRLYDLSTGQCFHEETPHTAQITSVHVSNDEQYVLTNSRDHTLKLLDLRNLEVAHTFRAEHYRNGLDWNAARLSPDGRIVAAGSADGSVVFWSVEREAVLSTVKSLSSVIASVAWHPSGDQLAVAHGDRNVQVWS